MSGTGQEGGMANARVHTRLQGCPLRSSMLKLCRNVGPGLRIFFQVSNLNITNVKSSNLKMPASISLQYVSWNIGSTWQAHLSAGAGPGPGCQLWGLVLSVLRLQAFQSLLRSSPRIATSTSIVCWIYSLLILQWMENHFQHFLFLGADFHCSGSKTEKRLCLPKVQRLTFYLKKTNMVPFESYLPFYLSEIKQIYFLGQNHFKVWELWQYA